MISQYLSVLFIHGIYIFYTYTISATKLTFLFSEGRNVIRCSAHDDYLIFSDWSALSSSNISCPNQDNLFDTNPPKLIRNHTYSIRCNEHNMQWAPFIKAYYWKTKKGKDKNICQPSAKTLWGVPSPNITGMINNTYESYKFEAKCVTSELQIDLGYKNFSFGAEEKYILYMTYDGQPMVCRVMFNQSEFIVNNVCVENTTWIVRRLCYYDPLSSDLHVAVNWDFVQELFLNPPSYVPKNWMEKGGYYYNDLLKMTTDTASTATTISTEYFTSLSSSLFSSTVGTTAADSTSDLIQSSISSDTTIVSSSTATTFEFTSEKTETITTPITSNSVTLAESTMTDTLAISIINSTEMTSSIMTIPISSLTSNRTYETVITIPIIVTTKSSQIPLNSTMTMTTSRKFNTTKAHGIKFTTSTKLMQKNPLTKKPARSFRTLYAILSVFIVGIIGSLGLLLFQRGKAHRTNLLSRKGSDDSFSSRSTASDDSSSTGNSGKTENKTKVPQQSLSFSERHQSQPPRNTGRIFTHFDPDSI